MKLTHLLITLCIALSFYAWNSSANLSFSKYALLNGNYYTLLTALFVHANMVHLLGNIAFLYVFGGMLEDEVGALRTGGLFLVGGMLSFILSIPFYPDANMVGASGAIFALMAALLLVRKPSISIQFLSPIAPMAILFFIYNILALHSYEKTNVAYVSHVIGFLIGLFFGMRWNPEWKKSLMYTLILLGIYALLYYYLRLWF